MTAPIRYGRRALGGRTRLSYGRQGSAAQVPVAFDLLGVASLVNRWRVGAGGTFQDLAGTVVADVGDPIGHITDEVGTDHLIAPGTGARPSVLAGGEGADFDGTDDQLEAGDLDVNLGADGVLELALWIWWGAGSDERFLSPLVGASAHAGALRYTSGSIDVWGGNGVWIALAPGLSTMTPYALQIRYVGRDVTVWVNGVEGSTVTLSRDVIFTGVGLGARFLNAFGNRLAGGFSELMLFDAALSSEDRASVHAYLTGEYS